MSKLYSSKEIEKVLYRLCFKFISQRGSHGKFRRGTSTVILPMAKKEIPFGTFRSILRQANMDLDEFKSDIK